MENNFIGFFTRSRSRRRRPSVDSKSRSLLFTAFGRDLNRFHASNGRESLIIGRYSSPARYYTHRPMSRMNFHYRGQSNCTKAVSSFFIRGFSLFPVRRAGTPIQRTLVAPSAPIPSFLFPRNAAIESSPRLTDPQTTGRSRQKRRVSSISRGRATKKTAFQADVDAHAECRLCR